MLVQILFVKYLTTYLINNFTYLKIMKQNWSQSLTILISVFNLDKFKTHITFADKENQTPKV